MRGAAAICGPCGGNRNAGQCRAFLDSGRRRSARCYLLEQVLTPRGRDGIFFTVMWRMQLGWAAALSVVVTASAADMLLLDSCAGNDLVGGNEGSELIDIVALI